MGELFQSFVYTMLGDTGLFLLDKYYRNENVLLIIFMIYATLLLYARCILVFYYPYRMKCLLNNLSEQQKNGRYIREKWLQTKQTFPFYILVPSRNELWIKRASKSSIVHGVAFFRDKKTHKSDYEQLDDIYDLIFKKPKACN